MIVDLNGEHRGLQIARFLKGVLKARIKTADGDSTTGGTVE